MSQLLSMHSLFFVTAIALAAPSGALGQAPTEIGKNHATVRATLAPVVAWANRSVVRVFSGPRTEDVALGVIVSTDGYVLTKASELTEAVECQLPNTQRVAARQVATDESNDLALLKIEANQLVPMQWAPDAGIEAGMLVAVPGRGELPLAIGMVGGLPRAVPPTEGVLGVVVRQTDRGPQITQVMPGSVAQRSGLQPDDVVTHVGRRRVALCRDLAGFINQFEPGQLFTLTVIRNGQTQAIETGLDQRDEPDPGTGLDRDVPSATRVPLSNRRGGFPQVFPHDTFLRPNDCGGPLVNLDGQAIGLNIARTDRTTSYTLPATVVQQALTRLLPK